jgi:hypothetical protein
VLDPQTLMSRSRSCEPDRASTAFTHDQLED